MGLFNRSNRSGPERARRPAASVGIAVVKPLAKGDGGRIRNIPLEGRRAPRGTGPQPERVRRMANGGNHDPANNDR